MPFFYHVCSPTPWTLHSSPNAPYFLSHSSSFFSFPLLIIFLLIVNFLCHIFSHLLHDFSTNIASSYFSSAQACLFYGVVPSIPLCTSPLLSLLYHASTLQIHIFISIFLLHQSPHTYCVCSSLFHVIDTITSML